MSLRERFAAVLCEELGDVCGIAGSADVVAGKLVAELWEERRTNALSSAGVSTNWKTGVTTRHSDYRYDRRWVSDWEVVPADEVGPASEGIVLL